MQNQQFSFSSSRRAPSIAAHSYTVYCLLECRALLCPGPARKPTFINASFRISIYDFIPIKQIRSSVLDCTLTQYLTQAHCTAQCSRDNALKKGKAVLARRLSHETRGEWGSSDAPTRLREWSYFHLIWPDPKSRQVSEYVNSNTYSSPMRNIPISL